MYEIIIEPPAERFIKTLNKEKQKELLDRINELSIKPRQGKELVGRLNGLRRLRIDNYRAIYRLEDAKLIIFILRVGHRKDIYSKNINQ